MRRWSTKMVSEIEIWVGVKKEIDDVDGMSSKLNCVTGTIIVYE